MTIRAVVFDIGGIFELVPEGGDPTRRFPELIARWEARLNLAQGEFRARLRAMNDEFATQGKDPGLGTCTEEEWQSALRHATGLAPDQFATFLREYWDVYLGAPNDELMAYFRALRPRYQTALLSNSGVGARREEEDRYHFAGMTDFIVYSHEVGIEKPDPRIYALTCDRLGAHPHEVVFLDDAEPNVAAARDFGLRAILYRNNAQAIADIQRALEE